MGISVFHVSPAAELVGGGFKNKGKMELTIEKVKACNEMVEPFKTTLDGLCDCWYKIALQEGKTESEAAKIALDKFAEKMLSFSSPAK